MALSTVTVSAVMKDSFRTEIQCSNPFGIDQPVGAGGKNDGPNPLEVFVSSLPACICAIARIVAMQRGIALRGVEAHAEADIDKNFLLGKTTEGRAGFVAIRVNVKIDADMTEAEKVAFLHEVEKRCPIADNMAGTTSITAHVVA